MCKTTTATTKQQQPGSVVEKFNVSMLIYFEPINKRGGNERKKETEVKLLRLFTT